MAFVGWKSRAVATVAVAIYLGGSARAAPRPPLRLTIVATNDVHGWILPKVEKLPRGELRAGGLGAFSGYLRTLRARTPVVLVDAGDMFQGTLVSNAVEGASVVRAYNLLGYDAACLGNHDFDFGPVGPATTATTADQDPLGAIEARVAEAKFPIFSANVWQGTRRPSWIPQDGTALISRGGIKVGIFALSTTETPILTLPPNVKDLSFQPLIPAAVAAAESLRARGAEVVVALVHASGECRDAAAVSTCDTKTGDVFTLANGLPRGLVDVIAAGHAHSYIGQIVNGIAVVESGSYGHSFATVDLAFDATTRQLLPAQTTVRTGIEICETTIEGTNSCAAKTLKDRFGEAVVAARFEGAPIVPDTRVVAALDEAWNAVASQAATPLKLSVVTRLERNRESESSLGSLVADAIREAAQADVALMNPGGLRADLSKGPLTYGKFFETFPFDNRIATLELSGEQLGRLVRVVYAGRKGVFQVSGAEIELARCPDATQVRKVTVRGQELDPSARYRVALPDFLAYGGDGLASFMATLDKEAVVYGDSRSATMRDDIIALWQRRGQPLAAPAPGRIEIMNADGFCERASVEARRESTFSRR